MKVLISTFVFGKSLSQLLLLPISQIFEFFAKKRQNRGVFGEGLYDSLWVCAGLVLSSCAAEFLKVGKEYLYKYESAVEVGSNDYAHFYSTFNISGKLRLQKTDATTLTMKLDELQFSAFNGEKQGVRVPETTRKAYQQLNPLMEPIQVKLDSNTLVQSVVLSGNIPEWARNIHRGLASALQIDSVRTASGQETNFEVVEVKPNPNFKSTIMRGLSLIVTSLSFCPFFLENCQR